MSVRHLVNALSGVTATFLGVPIVPELETRLVTDSVKVLGPVMTKVEKSRRN